MFLSSFLLFVMSNYLKISDLEVVSLPVHKINRYDVTLMAVLFEFKSVLEIPV